MSSDAYSPAGYFLVVDGISALDRNAGILHYGDFASGRLDDNGIVQTDLNWISTPKLIAVLDYGTDDYFLGPDGHDSYVGKYWSGCAAKMCQIKNTQVYDSACGVFSVVGPSDGLWIHDCYTNRDGMRPGCE